MLWEARVQVPAPALCLLSCVNVNKSLPFFGPQCSHLSHEGHETSKGPTAWIHLTSSFPLFLISPSCPPGPRPPMKRQDTGLSPNLSFSWRSVSDQEVGKQDFLWGCSLWPRQFRFKKQRGDKERHPGFQTLKSLSVGLMFSSTPDFELLKSMACVIQSWKKTCWYPFKQLLLTFQWGKLNYLFLFK